MAATEQEISGHATGGVGKESCDHTHEIEALSWYLAALVFPLPGQH